MTRMSEMVPSPKLCLLLAQEPPAPTVQALAAAGIAVVRERGRPVAWAQVDAPSPLETLIAADQVLSRHRVTAVGVDAHGDDGLKVADGILRRRVSSLG